MSINKACISGNLTKDMEVRQTAEGIEIGSFTVAVNERRKDKNGEWNDFPNYIDCTMFGSRAAKIVQYLTKGAKVAIEGKLRQSTWERDGQKRSKVEVIVDEVEFLSRSQRQAQADEYQPSYQQSQTYQQASVYDTDIPF